MKAEVGTVAEKKLFFRSGPPCRIVKNVRE